MTQEHGDKQEMNPIFTLNAKLALEECKAKHRLIEDFLEGKKIETTHKEHGWIHTLDPDWSLPSNCLRAVKEDIKVGDTVRLKISDRIGVIRSIFTHKFSGACRYVIELPEGVCYIQNCTDVIPVN